MNVIATVRQGYKEMDLYNEIENLISLGIKTYRINAGKFIDDVDALKEQLDILYSFSDKISIILDIPFPGKKYRIKMINGVKRGVKKGEKLVVTINGKKPSANVNADYFSILGFLEKEDLKGGKHIYYDDGSGEFIVTAQIEEDVYEFEALTNCIMYNKKSISIQKIEKIGYENYIHNICKRNKVNAIALSFVESQEDLIQAYKLKKIYDFQIISKIESELGIQNAYEIAEYSDGIMIGRGDLPLYSNFVKLLEYEDFLADICKKSGCDYYIATDILSSMREKNIPNRSEIIDLAYIMRLRPEFIVLNYDVVFSENINRVLETINEIYFNEIDQKKG